MIAVVVPAFDCAATIGDVVASLPSWVDRAYVVDDGNENPTRMVLASLPLRATVLRHHENRGVGAAVVTGYRRALDDGATAIVKLDADGQMDPTQMWRLVTAVQALHNAEASDHADYAKGTRWQHPRRCMPWMRRIGTRALSWWLGVEDAVNGYTAITAAALRQIDLNALDPRYGFEVSMLLEAKRVGLRVMNVPMPARYGSETSHLRLWHCALTFPALLMRRRA